MIVIPANPNEVHVGMVRTGCFKTQFSLNYPARLNGIVSQHEFRESINNINSKISSNKAQICCLIFSVVCIIGGLALVLVGAASQRLTSGTPSLILFVVGFLLISIAPLFSTIGLCVIRNRRTNKMRQAIAEESKKYSTRSPAICSWRLKVNRMWTGGYGRYTRSVFFYQVIIDIRHPVTSTGNARLHTNHVPPRPASTSRPQYDIPPPPYPGPAAAFCSQCGGQRIDPAAKFCSSCGHQFDKY